MYGPLLLAIGYYLTQLPWTFIFLLTQRFGVRLYTLTDSEECKRIQKRIGVCSTHITDNDKGYGYSVGYWYILNISVCDHTYNIWMIATEASYKSLLNGANENGPNIMLLKQVDKTDITIYERIGSLTNPWYKKRTLKINTMEPRSNQDVVMQQIKEHYDIHRHTVAYLHGAPGTGKSVIGILLANIYKSSYCNTLKPWQPGDNVSSLYSEIEPTPEAPLILVFDEFDRPLQQIHDGIPSHPKLPIQMANKTGWNQLLDEIHIGVYPNLILLLTSNVSPDFIKDIDPSYIREGRVDLIIEM